MLSVKAAWNLKAVVMVYILRLLVGMALVRVIYPLMFTVTPSLVEITDRVVVIVLVAIAVWQYQGSFRELGLSLKRPLRSIITGLVAGAVLLTVSLFSERIYTAALFISPTQHPLVAQAEKALNWQDLLLPLFLAGLAAPIAEEIMYRLFTFLPLKDRWGVWGGAIASSAIFALMHFNAYWLAEMMVVGTGLALLYYYTGSLISAIVAHSFINTTKIVMIFLGLPLT
ncbi:MAG: CPBP family intramembrane glutamic endopeptidase [Negativicutes bacterium]